MATLQGAISEIVDVIAAVDSVNHVPDEPTEQVTIWPAAMVYATDGLVSPNRASVENKTLHSITVAVIMPLNDMRQATKIMLPLYEPIANALIGHLNGRTSQNYSTWGGLEYTLGPIEWPQGQVMYGYIFTLREVKIINDIT